MGNIDEGGKVGMFEEKLLYFIFIDGGETKLAESNRNLQIWKKNNFKFGKKFMWSKMGWYLFTYAFCCIKKSIVM